MEVLYQAGKWRDWVAGKWLTSYRLNALRTAIYGLAHKGYPTQLALVLGCQRSGTTMLANVLGLSPLVRVYGEGDPRYFRWEGAPRLLPLEDVANRLAEERNPFTLLKPLCESQRATEILEAFPTARAVWIFRHYRDCVASHVRYYRKFHDGLAYAREMLQTDAPCWKNEHLARGVVDLLASFSSRTLTLETAYALHWLARNSLFEVLPEKAPIKLVSYERIVENPIDSFAAIFDYLSIPFNSKYCRIVTEPASKQGKSRPSEIDAKVAEYCDALLERLSSRELAELLSIGAQQPANSPNRNAPPGCRPDALECSS